MGLRPLAGWDYGFESRREHVCLSVVIVVCCQVEVSATDRSPIQRSSTECDVTEYDLETSTMRKSRLTRAVEPRKKNICASLSVKIMSFGKIVGDFSNRGYHED